METLRFSSCVANVICNEQRVGNNLHRFRLVKEQTPSTLNNGGAIDLGYRPSPVGLDEIGIFALRCTSCHSAIVPFVAPGVADFSHRKHFRN